MCLYRWALARETVIEVHVVNRPVFGRALQQIYQSTRHHHLLHTGTFRYDHGFPSGTNTGQQAGTVARSDKPKAKKPLCA